MSNRSPVVSSGAVTRVDLPALTARFPVLHSDDDAQIVKLVQTILKRAGLRVIGTLDPRDVLTICRGAPISLVISDVMKPVMNGFELFEVMRADAELSRIPFLFLTSETSAVWRKRGLQMGADGYLGKPVFPRSLLSTVTDLLVTSGNWQAPGTLDAAMCATLTSPISRGADERWHGKVWAAGP